MYLSYKLHYSYTFSIDHTSALTILEGGSFFYRGKSSGGFYSKLTKVKGRENPQGRSFVILNLEFRRKQKGGAPHFILLHGERDLTTNLENGKIVGASNLHKPKIGRLYQRQGDILTIG